MEIKIILPDDSVCGAINVVVIGKTEAYLKSAELRDLADGNIYDATRENE